LSLVAPWDDFYMMLGGASAALVGLLFIGLELFLPGAANLVWIGPRLRIVLAHREAPAFRDDAGRFGLAVLSYLGLVAVGVAIWSQHSDGLDWLVAVVLILLLTAARNAWELLVEMGEGTADGG
jgi:hypothetical protein